MGIIDCIEEIIFTHELCKKATSCERCKQENICCEVFGKKCPVTEIEELASQCKVFNEFARANKKGNE